MIETQPITEPHPVPCPHCKATLYTLTAEGFEAQDGPIYRDGDTVPIWEDLTAEQRDGFGWSTALIAGKCPSCGKPIFEITAQFMDAEPGAEVENVYFHRNDDRGTEVHFVAQRGSDTWTVTRCDTPQGPMLEHDFGPFADSFGDWIGPNGVTICRGGGPWDFVREFLLERWDELRTMPKAIGLDPADPRAQSRQAAVTARAARVARGKTDEAREGESILAEEPKKLPPYEYLAANYDDDVSF